MQKQSLMKASAILAVAGILAKVLGLLFRWPLIMLIGDEGMGYYQMTYPLYMFFIAMASGVPVAISKLISEKKSDNDIDGVFEVVKESTILMLFLGLGTTLVLSIFSKQIIAFLNWDMKSYYSLIGISFAPVIISIMTVYRGFFQGLQNMYPSGVSQLLEQMGRVIFGVGLAVILLPKGIEVAAGGAAFGAAAGGLMGCIFLVFKYRSAKKEFGIKKIKTNTDILNQILKIAIPISVGGTVGTIMTLIDSIMVPQKLMLAGFSVEQSTVLYGQLTGKAGVLTNIPMSLSLAICTALVPVIAGCIKKKNKKELDEKVQQAFKLTSVISLPSMVGLFLLADPIMRLIFPGRFEGATILQYLSLTIPFVIATQVTTAIFQGTGNLYRPIINMLIACTFKVALTWILVPIPEINVYGAIIATVVAYIVSTILNLVALKSKVNPKFDIFNTILKPFVASLLMAIGVIVTYYYVWQSTFNNVYSCLSAITLGIIIYVIGIFALRVFTIQEFFDKLDSKLNVKAKINAIKK